MGRNLFLIAFLLFTGLLFIQFNKPAELDHIEKEQLSERINLALRQVGHQLLHISSDSTTQIPPVENIGNGVYKISLQQYFNYDTLPHLLHGALEDFGINQEYYVTVKNCKSDTIILGYNILAFEKGNVSCVGREQKAQCSNIFFSLVQAAPNSQRSLFLIPILLLTVALLFAAYKFVSIQSNKQSNSNVIKLGNTSFDPSNQVLQLNGQSKRITYRENKLLSFLSAHPNEVLERERILAEVWNDEGVMVGRSLDVFISRLRKLLTDEKAVKIKNIHGVGYRFELIDS